MEREREGVKKKPSGENIVAAVFSSQPQSAIGILFIRHQRILFSWHFHCTHSVKRTIIYVLPHNVFRVMHAAPTGMHWRYQYCTT